MNIPARFSASLSTNKYYLAIRNNAGPTESSFICENNYGARHETT